MLKYFEIAKSSKGMTLVEVLIVMGILGIVVMAAFSLYLPAAKSTAVQSEVTDLQSNLRLAINAMTKDLLTAGFLTGDVLPIIFQGSATPTTAANPDDDDFTIQTTLVGGGFARVISASGDTLTLSNADMLDSFGAGSYLRLLNPVSAKEIETDQIYQVTATDNGAKTLTINPALAVAVDPDIGDLVIVKTRSGTPLIQQIRYQLLNGSLTRTVNGTSQNLAQGIDTINFTYDFATNNRVRNVEITLTGKTPAHEASGAFSEKTRELKTSVTLRNIF